MNLSELRKKYGRSNYPDNVKSNAVADVLFVPIEMIQSNDYNPNSVPTNEMRLLHLSIKEDTYTMPVVTIYDEEIEKFVIIDGFHRYTIMRKYKDISEKNGGRLPIVVLDKNINQRMASTVRHNRARGKHSVDGMSNMVFEMLQNGMSDSEVCNKLGMEPDELVRLKHITGFSKLFSNTEYNRGWESKEQIQNRNKYLKEQADGN